MDLNELHYHQKNRLARDFGVIIYCAIIFFSVSGLTLINPIISIIKIVISAIFLIASCVLYKSMGNQRKYKFVITIPLALLYPVAVLTAISPEIYALMFCIIILVLIYGEVSTVIAGAAVAMITVLLNIIRQVRLGNLENADVAYMFLCALLSCILASLFCRQQRRHNAEVIKATEDAAAEQIKISEKIVDLAGQLNTEFLESKASSDRLNAQMDSTHASVLDIVEGAKSTAEAIENQTSQTAGISESISKVGDQATNIENISNKVEEVVAEGVKLIEQLKNQAKQVAEINLETQSTTKELNDSIKDVQDITQTILGISAQTNLLALNASIEAARAGEAGKGFAVVADEIRALSESTREATEQIAGIIARLTADANNASDAMQKSANFASRQAELIEETGTKLSEIKLHSDELHDGVVEVNHSVGEVIEANSAIMDSITNLSATSQEMAASTDTVLSITDSTIDALGTMNENLSAISGIAEKMSRITQ